MQHAENLQSRIDEQVKNSLLSVLSDFQDGIPDTPPPLEEHTEPAQIHNVSNARTNNQCHTQDDWGFKQKSGSTDYYHHSTK